MATIHQILTGQECQEHVGRRHSTLGLEVLIMGAAREKDQADFDLERFVDMFDEAVNSQDPRVVRALRDLMMMVTLTRPESRDAGLHNRNHGPLRRLFEDMHHLHRRLERMEDDLRSAHQRNAEIARDRHDPYNYPYEKFSMKAAAEMAAQIDQDVLSKIKAQNVAQIKPPGKY